MQLASNRILRIIARLLQIAVAVIFIVAAGLKALDPPAFADQIRAYGILPQFATAGAWAFIVFESILAGALLANVFPRSVASAGIALLALFVGATAYASAHGGVSSCGCFGNLAHRTPQQVMLEDALMIGALVFVLLVRTTPAARTPRWRFAVPPALGAAACIIALISPSLPVDNIATALRPGAVFTSWPVEGLQRDLLTGTHLVFLFSADSKTIDADVALMNAIAQDEHVPSTVGLSVDGPARLSALVFERGIGFPVGAIDPRFARSLYRTLPRTFILKDGTVERVWSTLPPPSQVEAAFRALTPASGSPDDAGGS